MAHQHATLVNEIVVERNGYVYSVLDESPIMGDESFVLPVKWDDEALSTRVTVEYSDRVVRHTR